MSRAVVRKLWRSVDGGRTWQECDVLARSPLSGGVSHAPDSWWEDGMGNCYRNAPPPTLPPLGSDERPYDRGRDES